jgi:hypothetical protein
VRTRQHLPGELLGDLQHLLTVRTDEIHGLLSCWNIDTLALVDTLRRTARRAKAG